ncbi:MAG: PDZ domain-containing protein [Ignavibacteriales bacterium]|nr:PDZ domain-containing protein [Ignavibacteriales bacterium]
MKRFRRTAFFIVFGIAGLNALLCQQVFEVNLNDRSGDTFKVTLYPKQLSASNNVFQFASTAPGTYQVMDIGRFVHDFKAFGNSGNEVPTEHISTNQWTISRPTDVRKITYTVEDMWDAKVDKNRVYSMASTTISDDFVMINGQGVFGYFNGMQSEPIKIKLDYPSEWKLGTALEKGLDGYYEAENFDKVVDSPFYLGKLTTATTEVGGAKIGVYLYSRTGLITADDMLASLKAILKAESDFTKGLPVDRYVFLFYFGNFDAGAWEHSYSSEYVMKEDTLKPSFVAKINSVVAHEFFHINTPLNIHSELIERFNFVKPVTSKHLWLYEGTTEWAANMLQLRASLIPLDQYLRVLQSELSANDGYNQNLSLTDLGVHSTEMQDEYPNIYQKGAFVSTLLDIRLLERSHGKKGLRELLIELSKKFGKERSFSEEEFFNQLGAMTYPEIGDFFDRYIKGSEKLPVKEYFGQLGIDYQEKTDVDSNRTSMGIILRPAGNMLGVKAVYEDSKSGLMKGDIIMKIDTTVLTFQNAGMLFGRFAAMKPGNTVRMTVKRKDKEVEVACVLTPRVTRHKFTVNPNASPEQLQLREVWMKNM